LTASLGTSPNEGGDTAVCDTAIPTVDLEPVLAHYNYDLQMPLRLAADASMVISHAIPDGSEHPTAYASRMLTASEKNYAQLEKEALALLFGVHKFHQYLYGRRFTLIIDHKPLLSILGPKKGVPSLTAAYLQHLALILTAYNYQIEFKTTSAQANADGLSCLPLPSPSLISDSSYIVAPLQNGSLPDVDIFVIRQLQTLLVTSKQLKVATRCDPILSHVFRYTQQGCPSKVSDEFKPYYTRRDELTLEGGCVMWGVWIIVPKKLQETYSRSSTKVIQVSFG